MTAALAVLRRELLSYFLSPLSYVIAALFLLVHGYSFYLLCEVLSQRQAVTSSVMQYFFGGTFLYWLFLMFVASALTMRLFSEERQQGTLEALLTAPVREEALVLGKYLAALVFYLALWAPTLAYPLLLHAHASAGAAQGIDPGPIAAGYLGTLLCGLSALGIGVLGSALSRSQVLAAVLSFVTLSLLLLVGMLADVYVKHEGLRQALLHVNLFHHMDELGRGILDSRRVVYHLSLAAAALFVAGRVLKVRPGDRVTLSRAAAEGALCLALLVGVNVIAARHPVRLDLTRTGQFTLSPRLLDLLGALRKDGRSAEAYVFMYDDGADKNDLYDDVHELLLRVKEAAGGHLSVEFIDVDRDRERARLLGEKFRINRDDLREGVIVVQAEGRQRFIPRAELAEYQTEAGEAGPQQRLAAFRGEAALAGALLTVLMGKTPEICFTRGHGESEHDSMTGSGLSDLSEALRRENYAVRALELGTAGGAQEVPAGCDVVVAAGPERPFLPVESAALGRYLERGGRLLALLGPLLDRELTGFLDSGLTGLLRERGIGLPQGVVVDPEHQLSGSLAWLVEEGYADHPVSAPLMHRRTLWTLARPLAVLPAVPLQGGALWSAQQLVQTGEKGFVETDLAALRDGNPRFTQGADTAGPVTVAAASAQQGGGERQGRIVVFGSAQLATNDGMVLFNRDLVRAALSYLAEAGQRVVIEPKRPESLRLALSEEGVRRVMLVTLLGMPLMAVLLGLGVFWIRRG
jgi:ABC-2 type transport system permease protein